ncbi:putative oxidoreductase component of anaerobic dehydrogenase [Enhygromyxa salina]|uniref:Putative oxidoreductase component of anaerobic dehydrogenase n=1 Tax=Enhygromyxa salina TaxID=215803 RepID=A0A0C1ZTX3_9BACT|nr:molecular chaperone TorD family protein [Enhygromyxa salina]KIG14503.1 putative oxidoreductase component of anaerobic dehydrogenase [Enhygromyxa salina]
MGADAEQQALGRSRLYALLARLFVRGATARSLAQLGALEWVESEPLDHDELAAAHHACFSLGVFPYAGVFLDPAAQAGACADRVRSFYEQVGFAPRLDELSADHLGIEFAFLSFVTGAQAEAHADGRPELVTRCDAVLAKFLDACVLSYLPAFVCACEDLSENGEHSLWPKIARGALELVAEHRSHLPGTLDPVALPAADPLLQDRATGLRELARYLLTPAKVGVFFSRADIGALGRRHEVPRGFGPRELMLDNLLRSAAEYGELTGLLDSLDAVFLRRDDALAQIASSCAIEPAIAPWRAAIASARTLLSQLRDASTAPSRTSTDTGRP